MERAQILFPEPQLDRLRRIADGRDRPSSGLVRAAIHAPLGRPGQPVKSLDTSILLCALNADCAEHDRLCSGLDPIRRLPRGERVCHYRAMVSAAGGKPLRLVVSTHDDQDREDREYWRNQSPEARLDAVELLRIQSGQLLYDYPTRLRRTIAVTRKANG